MDLILVSSHTQRTFVERPLDFPEILNMGNKDLNIDLLVYTPREFQDLQAEQPKVGFWKSAFEQMKKIY